LTPQEHDCFTTTRKIVFLRQLKHGSRRFVSPNEAGAQPVRQEFRFCYWRNTMMNTHTASVRNLAASALLGLGLAGTIAGAALARPMQDFGESRNGAEILAGFDHPAGPDSHSPGSCEGRKGAAILGGFANATDPAVVNGRCRY
jgi:hypothetical protein